MSIIDVLNLKENQKQGYFNTTNVFVILCEEERCEEN